MTADAQSPVSWVPWLRREAESWLFVARTVIGMLLALAIAFRFDLSSPGSAAVTVSIIALPQTGMVLEKSFYRLVGTVLGAFVTLVLLANLEQHRDTFILAVALWIGVCTAASSWFRGFQAYGWLLCGYTTCLIGFPAFVDASHAFDIAVDRVTIVGVGILSAGIVNAVILPTRSTTSLVQQVRRSFIDFAGFVDAATRAGGVADLRRAQHAFSRDLQNLDLSRASSVFEDPESRIRSPRLFGYIAAFMAASGRLHLLHRQLDALAQLDPQFSQLGAGSGGPVRSLALEPLLQAFRQALRVDDRIPTTALQARPLAAQLQELLDRWPPTAKIAVAGDSALLERQAAQLRTDVLLKEAVRETQALAAVYADMHSVRSRGIGLASTRPRFASDALQASIAGLRAALVVVITCAFWIASAWPEGFSLTLLGAVGCALFSSVPHPVQAAQQMCKGFLLGLPALIVCYGLVLPAANDYASLALGLLPFLVLGAWLMTRPGKILAGSGYFLMFLTGLNLNGLMAYDFMAMVNGALALLFGIGTAALSLAVLAPGDRAWRPQRARQLLLSSLAMARQERLPGIETRFHSRVRDLTLQLMAMHEPGQALDEDGSLGLAILEAGDAIIRLRRSAGDMRHPAGRITELLDAVVAAVEQRDGQALRALDEPLAWMCSDALARRAAPDAVEGVSGIGIGVDQVIVALGVLRLALADLSAAWLTSNVIGEAFHAA